MTAPAAIKTADDACVDKMALSALDGRIKKDKDDDALPDSLVNGCCRLSATLDGLIVDDHGELLMRKRLF